MRQESIDWALAQGAPITCATCRFFHEGNMVCGKTECGGPSAGRDFPSYDGPIPREKLVDRCLVCGSAEPKFLIVGLDTKFALCKKHRKTYDHVGNQEPDSIRLPVLVVELP